MITSYYSALRAATELVNMPDPESSPAKFIQWSEDICELISYIYGVGYDQVTEDLQERLNLLDEEDEEDEEDEDE